MGINGSLEPLEFVGGTGEQFDCASTQEAYDSQLKI